MIEMTPLDGDYEFFSAETVEDIILLRFKENLLVRATDFDTKDTLFNFIGRISSQVDIVKRFLGYSLKDLQDYLVPERKLGFFVKIKPPAQLLSEA